MDFYVGVVEDRNDPKAMGRVRVRVLGLHSPDRLNDIPIESLPWSNVMMPANMSTAAGGVSQLVEGTWVVCMYWDENMQDPIVMGSLPNMFQGAQDVTSLQNQLTLNEERQAEIPAEIAELRAVETDDPEQLERIRLSIESLSNELEELKERAAELIQRINGAPTDYEKGFSDPFGVYPRVSSSDSDTTLVGQGGEKYKEHPTYHIRNRLTLQDIPMAKRYSVATIAEDDPSGEYDRTNWSENVLRGGQNSIYPYNNVNEYEGGMIEENDSTPANQRTTRMHPSGSYDEILVDGTKTVKIVGDGYEITMGNHSMYVKGDLNLTVEGNMRQLVKGDYTLEVGGGYHQMITKDRSAKLLANDLVEIGVDQAINITNNRNVKVGVNETLIVGNDQTETIGNDHTLTINNDSSTQIGNDRAKMVGNDESAVVVKNRTISVGVDQYHGVIGNDSTEIDGNQSLVLVGKQTNEIQGNQVTDVSGNIKIDAGGNIDADASNIYLN